MNKYHSIRTVVNGHSFDSKHEANTYRQLLMLKSAKKEEERVVDIELQPEYELQPKYIKDGKAVRAISYRGDFLITYATGNKVILDAKGMKTPVYLLKRKLFHYQYPDLTIVEV